MFPGLLRMLCIFYSHPTALPLQLLPPCESTLTSGRTRMKPCWALTGRIRLVANFDPSRCLLLPRGLFFFTFCLCSPKPRDCSVSGWSDENKWHRGEGSQESWPSFNSCRKVNLCLVKSMWEIFLSRGSPASSQVWLLACSSFFFSAHGVVLYAVPPCEGKNHLSGVLFSLLEGWAQEGWGCLSLVLTQRPGKMHFT